MAITLRPMLARDPQEHHRASTQLELFFDLVTVIAVSAVSVVLHHGISAGHGLETLPNFIALFLVIWWAWMNFTWFSSAFDNGDPLYILLTLVVMSGATIFAGGVESIAATLDFSYALVGWIVMRIGMIALWLRAGRSNPVYRRTALRYAVGIALAQVLWTALYFWVPPQGGLFLPLFFCIFVVEILVPVIAERAHKTPWHRHHLIERYGLLNIIVMGEVMISISLIFGKLYEGHATVDLTVAGVSGFVIAFGLWWLYFMESEQFDTSTLPKALLWGYGHVIVFCSGAMVAAGLGAVMDALSDHSALTVDEAARWCAVPVASYLFGLWFIRERFLNGHLRHYLLLIAALVFAGLAAVCAPVWVTAIVLIGTGALRASRVEVCEMTPGSGH